MKILLLLAAGKLLRDGVSSGRHHRVYAPRTLLILQALVPRELRAEVQIIDQGVESLPEDFNADLLAVSAITSAATEAYRVAGIARGRGIPVVMGGYHASLCTEEALQHVDSVVVGFAERTWPRLLHDFSKNRMKRVYEDASTTAHYDTPPLDRSLLGRRKYFTENTVESTRGCPNGCQFCVINQFTAGRSMQRPIRSVIEEVETLGKNIIFFDPSPFEFRSYLKELLTELIPLNINWYGATTMRLAQDDEMFDLAVRSGCKGVFLGFESVTQGSLDGTGKGFNESRVYERFVRKLHDHGIGVLGSFALGFDQDDLSVFDRTVDFVIRSQIDIVKLGIVTPLPGSSLYRSLKRENRILTEDWGLYDTNHCVFEPALMSRDELEAGHRRAYRQIYSYSSILRRVIHKKASYKYIVPANLVMRGFI